MTPKIATCCYCGTRAALILDKNRHELSCASCGAPLHDLKRMPVDSFGPVPDGRTPKTRKKGSYRQQAQSPRKIREKPRKRNKSLLRMVFEEAIDAIDDIFD